MTSKFIDNQKSIITEAVRIFRNSSESEDERIHILQGIVSVMVENRKKRNSEMENWKISMEGDLEEMKRSEEKMKK